MKKCVLHDKKPRHLARGERSGSIHLWLVMVVVSLVCSMLSCAPKKPEEAPNAAQVVPSAQEMVQALAQRDFAGAEMQFDNQMKQSLPPDKLQGTWDMLEHTLGHFNSQADIRTEYQRPYTLVHVTCQMKMGKIDVKLVFDAQNQITGLWLLPL